MKQQTHPKVTVAMRRLTPEEERRLNVALDLFLAEMVRQQLSHGEGNRETSRTERKAVHRPGPL
jgi:hypothetical protein